MAKKPTITTVSSGFKSTTTINDNFQNLRNAFDNTLSLDGSTPNAMNADLDMNGNDIINVGSSNGNAILTVNTGDARYVNTSGDTMTGSLNTPALYTNGLYINGNPVLPNTLSYNGIVKETKIATSGQTVFNLSSISYTPGINNLAVYVDGVYQRPANYTETNATRVTFSVGIHVGGIVDFVVLTINSLSGTADAVNLTYTAPGTGANSRTVYSKLSETVSVKDFGAVGDGVTDDTAALATAFAASKQLYFPPGTYLVDAAGYPTKRAVLYSASGNNIILSGYGATIKYKNTAGGPIGLNFVELVNAENVIIEGFTFDGNKQLQNYGYDAIVFFGGKNLTVRDVNIKNMSRDGIYVRGSTPATASTYPDHVLIDNVICDACGRNGISVIGANNIIIQNSILKNTAGDPGAGIDAEPNLSDIHGIRNLIIDGCTVTGNAGRGIVITGNSPANPGETPYCINARITNIIANRNSVAQDASARGCDIAVFQADDVIIDGYSNTAGETYNPVDPGLIYIYNSVRRAQVSNVYFYNCNFTTNTRSLVYFDASNNEPRNVNGVYADTCNAVIVSGGNYSNVTNVYGKDCTGDSGVIVGALNSALRNVFLINCPLIISRNTAGTGIQTLENITFINPTGYAVRLYGSNSTYRNITVRNTGTASAAVIWLENLTNCALENIKVTDNGGYWNTLSNVYVIGQTSLSGNSLRNIFPSPLSGSATWDPASILSASSSTTTVSLLRADVGDPCVVKHSVSLAGLMTFASVTSANTATVTLFNPTGGAIDLASHTVSVEAVK